MENQRNCLLCGYLREFQMRNKVIIPIDIVFKIDEYCIKYLIYGIGHNKYCQLGIGEKTELIQFEKLQDLELLASSAWNIYYNTNSLSVITSDNDLYVIGFNESSRLGLDKNMKTISSFTNIAMNEKVLMVSHGSDSDDVTFIQTISNKVYASGKNTHFVFGHNDPFDTKIRQEINTNFVKDGSDNIIDICCGTFHTLFLTKNGRVYSCGSNTFGRCGQGNNNNDFVIPTLLEIPGDKCIKSISCVLFQNLLIDQDGRLIVFGSNFCNGCGMNESVQHFLVPTVNTYFEDNHIKLDEALCGDTHSICLDNNGICYTFGDTDSGALGIQQNVKSEIINKVKDLELIRDISAGSHHNLLISINDNIISFGNNEYKQCSSINKSEIIYKPYLISKQQELNVNENFCVERVIAMREESIIILNYIETLV